MASTCWRKRRRDRRGTRCNVLGMTDRRLVFMMLALAIVLVAVALAA